MWRERIPRVLAHVPEESSESAVQGQRDAFPCHAPRFPAFLHGPVSFKYISLSRIRSPQCVLACDPSKLGHALVLDSRSFHFSLSTDQRNRHEKQEYTKGSLRLPLASRGQLSCQNIFPFPLLFLPSQPLLTPCQCDHAFFSVDADSGSPIS